MKLFRAKSTKLEPLKLCFGQAIEPNLTTIPPIVEKTTRWLMKNGTTSILLEDSIYDNYASYGACSKYKHDGLELTLPFFFCIGRLLICVSKSGQILFNTGFLTILQS